MSKKQCLQYSRTTVLNVFISIHINLNSDGIWWGYNSNRSWIHSCTMSQSADGATTTSCPFCNCLIPCPILVPIVPITWKNTQENQIMYESYISNMSIVNCLTKTLLFFIISGYTNRPSVMQKIVKIINLHLKSNLSNHCWK